MKRGDSLWLPRRLLWPGAVVAAWLLAGCAQEEGPAPQRPRTVRIEWLGHQAFLLTTSLGTKILTDPYAPGTVPHRFPQGVRPDVLLISAETSRTNHDNAVENIPLTLRGAPALGSNNAHGMLVRGTAVGDPSGGRSVVFTWSVDAMRFCFVGESLPALSELADMAPVDVVFINAAAGPRRDEALSALRPRIVIPMGGGGAVAGFSAPGLMNHRIGGNVVLLNRQALPSAPVALILAAP